MNRLEGVRKRLEARRVALSLVPDGDSHHADAMRDVEDGLALLLVAEAARAQKRCFYCYVDRDTERHSRHCPLYALLREDGDALPA